MSIFTIESKSVEIEHEYLGDFVTRGQAAITKMQGKLDVLEREYQRRLESGDSGFGASCTIDSGYSFPHGRGIVRIDIVVVEKGKFFLKAEGVPTSIDMQGVSYESIAYLEKGLRETLPTRLLIAILRDYYLEAYEEVLKVCDHDVEASKLLSVLEIKKKKLPIIGISDENRALGDIMLGIAMKEARLILLNRSYRVEEEIAADKVSDFDKEFLSRQDSILGLYKVEAESFSSQSLVSDAWRLSWIFMDERYSYSSVYLPSDGFDNEWYKMRVRIRYAREKAADRAGMNTEILPSVTLMGIPCAGKSTSILAIAEAVKSIFLDYGRVIGDPRKAKMTGHGPIKKNLIEEIKRYRGAREQVSRIVVDIKGARYLDGVEPNSEAMRLLEWWKVYLEYTKSAALSAWTKIVHLFEDLSEGKEQLSVFFHTMFEAPLVMSVVLNTGHNVEAYINDRYPDLLHKLENSSKVDVPDDVFSIVSGFISQSPFMPHFLEHAIGRYLLLDIPSAIAREKVSSNDGADYSMKRAMYLEYLPMMRLVNLCLAKMFPEYIDIVPGIIEGRVLSPLQRAWTYSKNRDFTTLSSAMCTYWNFDIGRKGSPVIEYISHLREEISILKSNLGRFTLGSLRKSSLTELIDM